MLARPETATDRRLSSGSRAIIAHEYFHNWTGNRITCRDWFQLCLKEGLTVFRDQQFSGDMRSHAVKRIEDVLTLRARQFREDAGPLAHPVRPESYVEINNFYTATVYEKGAEVIGMLKRLVGDDGYAKALDLYFDRHDGEAATIEDWLKVFEDATGRDLTQFKRWYSAGRHAAAEGGRGLGPTAGGTYRLTFTQRHAAHPGPAGQAAAGDPDRGRPAEPQWRRGGADHGAGDDRGRAELPLRRPRRAAGALDAARFLGPGGAGARGTGAEERAFLLAHDTDPFNRWEAGPQPGPGRAGCAW